MPSNAKNKSMQSALTALLIVGVCVSALATANTGREPAQKTAASSSSGNRTAPMSQAPSQPGLAPAEGDLYAALSASTAAFDLRSGETLRDALTRWCEDQGWTLVWKAKQDYQIDINLSFPQGTTMKDALRETSRAIWLQHPDVRTTVYKNKVVVVDEVAK